MPAERLMDMLVQPRVEWTADQVLSELTTYAPRAVATLKALQEEPVASAPLSLADLGTYPMHQLADAYAFDVYCHLRVDVVAPHGPIDRPVPPADEARLGPTIGWMLAGIPQMQGPAFGALDRPVVLELTGPGGGRWSVVGTGDGYVAVEPGTAEEQPETEAPPPNVLAGVQKRIRERSKGKFYADGWSTAKHPPLNTYLVTSLLMLAILVISYALLSPLVGSPVPVRNQPVPVQLIPR